MWQWGGGERTMVHLGQSCLSRLVEALQGLRGLCQLSLKKPGIEPGAISIQNSPPILCFLILIVGGVESVYTLHRVRWE